MLFQKSDMRFSVCGAQSFQSFHILYMFLRADSLFEVLQRGAPNYAKGIYPLLSPLSNVLSTSGESTDKKIKKLSVSAKLHKLVQMNPEKVQPIFLRKLKNFQKQSNVALQLY